MVVTSDPPHSLTGPYLASAFGLCRKSVVFNASNPLNYYYSRQSLIHGRRGI